MKQVLQQLKTGETLLADVPRSEPGEGQVLIRTTASIISLGTEKMLLDFGRAGWVDKARQQPEKVRQVLDKVRTDGIFATYDAVQRKLDQPIPLGYSNVGVVVESRSPDFKPGMRVVSNGPHAEYVCVPSHLAAQIPDGVSDETAVFTVLGAIALQGTRLLQPTLGETIVVMGLGLIGQLAVQILRAQGCRVLGVDLDHEKCRLAERYGAETLVVGQGPDPVSAARDWSGEEGVDGVLLTLATDSSEPVHQAADMCRKRGRIVLTGVAGLELRRSDFYEKELTFQVSCSYGPGRYDPLYENKGQDYPIGFVRWTENRNFKALLEQFREGRICTEALISHRFPIDQAAKAYDEVSRGLALGILLSYPDAASTSKGRPSVINISPRNPERTAPVIGVIGAGQFTGSVLLPALAGSGARLKVLASKTGAKAAPLAAKYGFETCTTDVEQVLNDDDINAVFITTRHDSHAALVKQALEHTRHVFVEKPLCLTLEELASVKEVYNQANKEYGLQLMVGFNRRFSPHIQRIKSLLEQHTAPKAFNMTVNAGTIPLTHWVQDVEQGGRIIGEGCHFIDLLRFLAGHPVIESHRVSADDTADTRGDVSMISLKFADGSIGTIQYLANGSRMFMKERLEVFCAGGILQLNNFRSLKAYRWKGFTGMRTLRQEKGHREGVHAFLQALKQGAGSPVPFDEIEEVSRLSIELSGHAPPANTDNDS